MATLPYLLWLTGREGLRPETAAALLRRFGTAEAVYFADEKEFELLQLPGRLCRSLSSSSEYHVWKRRSPSDRIYPRSVDDNGTCSLSSSFR